MKDISHDAYVQALIRLAEMDPRVVVLDADFGRLTGTAEFGKRFPSRYFNVGIAEQNMMSIAAGLAEAGYVPFATSVAAFSVRQPFNQIYTSIALANLPVKIVGYCSGFSLAAEGASHHALEDIALMRTIPGMAVVVPSTHEQTIRAVLSAAKWPGPVYLRIKPSLQLPKGDEDEPFTIGRAYLRKTGTNAVIVVNGVMVQEALRAAEDLAKRGISVSVLEMPTIKPFDTKSLEEAVLGARCVVVVEEHSRIGGLGSAVAEWLSEHRPMILRRVGVNDQFGQSATTSRQLWEYYGLTATSICAAVEEALAAATVS